MKIRKFVEPAILFAFGAAVMYYACNDLYLEKEGWATSAALFPMLMAGLLMLFGLIMFVSVLVQGIKAPKTAKAAETPSADGASAPAESNWLGVALVLLATAVFIILVGKIGFLISGTLYALALMLIFRDRNWIVMIAVAVVSTGLLYFSFTRLLHVLLP